MLIESLQELRIFLQVVDAGGFTGAGEALGLNTNAVSRHVARLESRLGVRLLTRTTRRVSVTEEGRQLYEHAVSLLRQAEEAEDALRRTSQQLEGTVRVAIRTTTLQNGFVGDLVGLLRTNAELRVQLIVSDNDVDLAAEGIDVALRVGDLADSSYRSAPLGQVTFVPAAAPSYVAERGLPIAPEDLAGHECIRPLFRRPQTKWRLINAEDRSVLATVSGRFESGDLRAQSDAIYGGLGIGLRPEGEVKRAEAEGTLVRACPGWSLRPLVVNAVLSPQRSRNARVEAILDIMRATIRRLG